MSRGITPPGGRLLQAIASGLLQLFVAAMALACAVGLVAFAVDWA